MNSKARYACTLCFSIYDTKDDAIKCALDSCEAVELKYECSDCETLWAKSEEANFCCSEEDTLELRAQTSDDTIFGDVDEGEEFDDGFDENL